MGMKRVPGGLLVAIEGIDGAGKTTVARALESWLVGVGALVLASKEPTRGPWGMKMRESAASGRLSPADERRFLLLDRKQHVEEVIAPALRQGGIVSTMWLRMRSWRYSPRSPTSCAPGASVTPALRWKYQTTCQGLRCETNPSLGWVMKSNR